MGRYNSVRQDVGLGDQQLVDLHEVVKRLDHVFELGLPQPGVDADEEGVAHHYIGHQQIADGAVLDVPVTRLLQDVPGKEQLVSIRRSSRKRCNESRSMGEPGRIVKGKANQLGSAFSLHVGRIRCSSSG